jgi:hypothetical protein
MRLQAIHGDHLLAASDLEQETLWPCHHHSVRATIRRSQRGGHTPPPHVYIIRGLQGGGRRLGGHLRVGSRLAGGRWLGRGQLLLKSQGRNLHPRVEVTREH